MDWALRASRQVLGASPFYVLADVNGLPLSDGDLDSTAGVLW